MTFKLPRLLKGVLGSSGGGGGDGSGGGDGDSGTPIAEVTDLVGTSALEGTTLTIPVGGIVDLGAFVTPQLLQGAVSWDVVPASNVDYVHFIFNAGTGVNWDGWGIRVSRRGTGGIAAHAGNDNVNAGNPEPDNFGGDITALGTVTSGEHLRFSGRLNIRTSASPRLQVVAEIQGRNGSASNGTFSNSLVQTDVANAEAAPYTARLIAANNSGQPVKLHLEALLVVGYPEERV